MQPIESFKHKGYTIELHQDQDASSPREDDNLGTMVCFHKRYDLGDKFHGLKSDDFKSWDELEAYLRKKQNAVIVLPIYMYDHSGITISTKPFRCPWDSGQIGLIYISREKVKAEYGAKKMSKKLLERVAGYLVNEVKTYDQFLTGDVYGYVVKKNDEDDHEDSCWGFFGLDYCRDEAKSVAENLWKHEQKEALP